MRNITNRLQMNEDKISNNGTINKNWVILIIIMLFLLVAYIILSVWSNTISLTTVTREVVIDGKIECKSVLDYPQIKKYMDIFSQLCLSGLVGVFISLFLSRTIEKKRTEEEKAEVDKYKAEKEKQVDQLREQINENVFDALFKKMVHEPTFQLVKEQIFKSKAIRKNAHWFFTFTDNANGGLNLSQQVVYSLENSGIETLKDPIVLTTDEKKNMSLKSAHTSIDGVTVLDFVADKDISKNSNKELESKNKYVKIGSDENGHFKIEINAEIPPKKTADFAMDYITIYDTPYIRDGYFTKYPLIDVLIKFTYPVEWELDVFFTIKTNSVVIDNKPGSYIEKREAGFLPGQGCIFTLTKK
jgi:hypothetical protein